MNCRRIFAGECRSVIRLTFCISKLCFFSFYCNCRRTAVIQCLRCCATNRKVAGSIPTGVIEIFHWHKILPIALWPGGGLSLWQKWVPGAFRRGKGGRCVRLTTLPPSCAFSWNLGTLTSWNPLGHSRPVTGLIYRLFNTIVEFCLA